LLLVLTLATLLLDIGQKVEVLLLLVVFGRSSLQGSKAFSILLLLWEAWHGASPQSHPETPTDLARLILSCKVFIRTEESSKIHLNFQ
jgi:hypothetical protein